MGIRGLKSFFENNEDLFIRPYHLHDSTVIVDASNLICALFVESQKHERRDLFGGDMVQFGNYLNRFFDNLKKCNVEPILVFDGAQTYYENKSKTAEKHRRAMDRFQNVLSISRFGFGDFILPATATNVFRSISVRRGIRIVQCIFEADLEVARLANEHGSPVLSNDSDFFLMGLKYGVLTIDLMKHEQVKRSIHTSPGRHEEENILSYIECSLFKPENFFNYLPNLNLNNLPLLGVLAGNDFVDSRVFDKICERFSKSRSGMRRQFKRTSSKQHIKILKILYFICGKTLNEVVNHVCQYVSKIHRPKLKQLIRSSLEAYHVPKEDGFRIELAKLYWPGYRFTYRNRDDEDLIHSRFQETIDRLEKWLKRAMENSVLSHRCLELAYNNIIFIKSHLDDPQLPSAHLCQLRPMRVMLTLLRSTYNDSSQCFVYDRIGYRYEKQLIKPLKHLYHFGELNYTLYDVPALTQETRRAILLATFHCSPHLFELLIFDYYCWFEPEHAEGFLTVKLLMDFIDIEDQQVRLWKHFRQATLLCILYRYYKQRSDEILISRLADDDKLSDQFMSKLKNLIDGRNFNKMPMLNRGRVYNCRLVHQITQLQSAIISFNGLNAFLGDIMARIRTEDWLNSCIIYNLTEKMHDRTLRLLNMPEIVYNIPREFRVVTHK